MRTSQGEKQLSINSSFVLVHATLAFLALPISSWFSGIEALPYLLTIYCTQIPGAVYITSIILIIVKPLGLVVTYALTVSDCSGFPFVCISQQLSPWLL